MMTVHVNGIVYFVLGVQMMIRKVRAQVKPKTLVLLGNHIGLTMAIPNLLCILWSTRCFVREEKEGTTARSLFHRLRLPIHLMSRYLSGNVFSGEFLFEKSCSINLTNIYFDVELIKTLTLVFNIAEIQSMG